MTTLVYLKHIVVFSLLIASTSTGVLSSTKSTNVMTFGKRTFVITPSTSCNHPEWGDYTLMCRCCLIKHAPRGTINTSQAQKVLQSCKKYCKGGMLEIIAREVGLDPNDFTGIVTKVIQKNTLLKYIDMSDQKLTNGNLGEVTSVVLLMRAVEQGYLEAPPKGQTFSAIKLGEGGAQTLQLFLIKEGGKARYILKEMKKGGVEVSNLQIIKNSGLKEFIMVPDKAEKERPALAMDARNFTYVYNGVDHHISLINVASGNAISDVIFDWTKNSADAAKKERARKALYRMGHNIGLIHVNFMRPQGTILGKTYVHGDMHPYNVFYDDANDRIIFIDNESFALSVKDRKDASIDIMKFYGRLVASNIIAKHAYRQKQTPETEFYQVIIKPFVKGYIEAYGNKKQEAFQKLYEVMSSQGTLKTYWGSSKTIVNPIQLYKSQKIYIKPLFEEIAREEKLSLPSSRLALLKSALTPSPKSVLGRVFKKGS